MKNRLVNHGIAIIGIAVLAFLSIASANRPSVPGESPKVSAVNQMRHWGVFGELAIYPLKDFVTCGLVFTEHTYQVDATDADMFTYQALLKEAQKLGADAIINVTIDRQIQTLTKTETTSTGSPASSSSSNSSSSSTRTSTSKTTYTQEIWYGSALAIKYTNMVILQDGQRIIHGSTAPDSPQPLPENAPRTRTDNRAR